MRPLAPVTVVCVYTSGPYPYTADYVVRLQRMAQRGLRGRMARFVCLTDRPAELPGIETIVVASLAGVTPRNGEGYWQKVRLFDPALGLQGRVLYLDLDTLVVGDLWPVVDYPDATRPATLALTEDALVLASSLSDIDRFGRRLVRRFNSSVMVWDAGTHADLWHRWSPAETARLSTDQDWIGEQAPDAVGMPLAWFPRISELVRDERFAQVGAPFPAVAKVVLTKKPKNAICVERWPWFAPLWGAA